MRKMNNRFAGLFMAVASIVAMSCDNNEELVPTDPDAEYDAVLKVKEDSTEITPDVVYDVNAETGATISTKITFVNTDGGGMKRLYITSNAAGTGAVIFEPELASIDVRADGGIGLENSNSEEFTFEIELPVPDTIETGTVVYTFWTTTGNGDPRDYTKRNAIGEDPDYGYGTITIRYGGANPSAPVKSYTAKLLVPPAEDLSSAPFISLVDGTIYQINQGAEYATFWDFGYYFTNQQGASFASTSAYEDSFVNLTTGEKFIDVDGIAGTTELNNFYFKLSTKTSANFDAVETSSDLNSIIKPTEQKISGLEVGDIIEFVDNYGKKGLIRVTELEEGFSPTTDYIKIDIKVQP